MQPVLSTGKRATSTKRAKICNRYRARENVHPIPSAEKYATGPSAGKHAAAAKRGQMRVIENVMFSILWLIRTIIILFVIIL